MRTYPHRQQRSSRFIFSNQTVTTILIALRDVAAVLKQCRETLRSGITTVQAGALPFGQLRPVEHQLNAGQRSELGQCVAEFAGRNGVGALIRFDSLVCGLCKAGWGSCRGT